MILGATYKTNKNYELIYLGRFYERNDDNKETKSYFFYDRNNNWSKITVIKSLSGNIIDVVNENCVEDYANLIDEMLKSSYYSTREQKYDEYKDYTLFEFKESFNKRNGFYSSKYYIEHDGKYEKYYIDKRYNYYYRSNEYQYNVYTMSKGHKDELIIKEGTIEQVFNKIKPKYLITYDKNKNIIKEWK